MPDLAVLPQGSSIFVDTNIFYLHFTGSSVICTAFFNRIARGEIIADVDTEVLSDLLNKLMLVEAFNKVLVKKAHAILFKKHLQSNRNALSLISDHQRQFEDTLSIGLKVIRITKSLLIKTKNERSVLGLMTNDSLHLGTINRNNVPLKNIAIYDGDFSHISTITVWAPQDVEKE